MMRERNCSRDVTTLLEKRARDEWLHATKGQ
jgi:hypothetical protein